MERNPRKLAWSDDLEIWEVVIETLTGPQWSVIERLAGYERPRLDVYGSAEDLGLGVPQVRRLRDEAVSALRRPGVLSRLEHDARETSLITDSMPSRPRCTAITTQGARCGNSSKGGSRLCEQHMQAALQPCAGTRSDGSRCGNPRLEGGLYCFVHYGADQPVWSAGVPGEAKLLKVPRLPSSLIATLWTQQESSNQRSRAQLLRRLSQLDDAADARGAFAVISDATSERQYTVARDGISALRPSEYWTPKIVASYFDSSSRWCHVTDAFVERASQLVLESPEDEYGQRSAALGHVGACQLVRGKQAATKSLWSAAARPRDLDRAIKTLTNELRWPANELRWNDDRHKGRIDLLARIIRTAEIRQSLLSSIGHHPERRSRS